MSNTHTTNYPHTHIKAVQFISDLVNKNHSEMSFRPQLPKGELFACSSVSEQSQQIEKFVKMFNNLN